MQFHLNSWVGTIGLPAHSSGFPGSIFMVCRVQESFAFSGVATMVQRQPKLATSASPAITGSATWNTFPLFRQDHKG